MKVFDTDFLVALLRGEDEVAGFLDRFTEEETTTTSINSFELFRGAFKSGNREENLEKTSELLSSLNMISFDEPASRLAGEIYAELEKKGQPLEIRDCLVAAMTMANNATLVTRNLKHFSRVRGLKLEQW